MLLLAVGSLAVAAPATVVGALAAGGTPAVAEVRPLEEEGEAGHQMKTPGS